MPKQELQALGEAVGTVCKGVSQDVLEALSQTRFEALDAVVDDRELDAMSGS